MKGRVAIVTGGASGIGLATVERLVADAWSVVSADLSARSCASAGATSIQVDVANAEAVVRMVETVIERHGRIDGLVHVAGISHLAPVLETETEAFDRVIAVNLRGAFLVGQAAARRMTEGGVIVNVASIAGVTPSYGRAAYAASKGGVIQLTRIMAVDLAPYGIRVNAVAPGPVNTPMIASMAPDDDVRARFLDRLAIDRFAEPSEIADAIAFLCSPDASFVSGQVLAVDGGFLSGGVSPPRAATVAEQAA